MKPNPYQQLKQAKELIPVVVLSNADDAVPLARAIKAAGGNFIEITLRTQAALKAIENIHNSDVDIIIGAGTVLTNAEVDAARGAGADFLVSPGFDPKVTAYAISQNMLMVPGTITPSEVQEAAALGLDLLKFFPAEVAGGAPMIKAFGSVYPQIQFMPTGGIHQGNVEEYIRLSNVGCIGGSWVCSSDDIAAGNFDQITQKLQQANALFG